MHAFTLGDLTTKDIKLLTQILHRYRLDEESGRLIVDLIASVPSRLRRSGFFNLVSNRSSRFPAVAPACPIHKSLNGHVIRSIFNLIALEVGVRINHLVARSEQFSYAQRAILQSLRELHSMWLEPDVYRNTFLEPPLVEWSYQENKCEACMLARIGENPNILICLRTVVLSRTRTKKRRRPPRISQWLEEWIERHEDFKQAMFQKSDEDGQALKRAWKEAYKRRVSLDESSTRERNSLEDEWSEKISAGYNGVFENGDGGDDEREPADNTDEDQYDYEHEIIDHYAALVSSQYLPLNPQGNNPSRQRASSTLVDRGKLSQEARNTRASKGSEWEDVTSVYWHPRKGPGWSNYFREVQSPGAKAVTGHNNRSDPTSNNRSSTMPGSGKSEKGTGSEQMADRYRGLVGRDSKRYSVSVYSREEGDARDSDVSQASTTWSMMYK